MQLDGCREGIDEVPPKRYGGKVGGIFPVAHAELGGARYAPDERSDLDRKGDSLGGRERLRCPLLKSMQDLDLVIQDLGIPSNGANEFHHLGENFIGMTSIVAHTYDTQRAQLPEIVVIDLGYGYIELVLHPSGDRLHHLALALKRSVFGQTKPHA